MMTTRVAVIHWFPIERYPPAFNLIRTLSARGAFSLQVYTTSDRAKEVKFADSVIIQRTPFPMRSDSRLTRLWRYLQFPFLMMFALWRFHPDVIFYYEPHSAIPVCLYAMINRRCRIFAHHHEYHVPAEFSQRGMRFAWFGHWMEKRFLYRRLEWLSQTNAIRNKLFLADHPQVNPRIVRELPNLPPREWHSAPRRLWIDSPKPLRLVYVGAVSLVDTFIQELTSWLLRQSPDLITLDVISQNTDAVTDQFLKSLDAEHVRYLNEGIAYDDLPAFLRNYHVGLILYRGNTLNYIHNAPNKLFEYLVCGLDVWFPKQMEGVKPFARTETIPRVIEVDFENLEQATVVCDSNVSREGLTDEHWTQTCEDACEPLVKAILTAPRPQNSPGS